MRICIGRAAHLVVLVTMVTISLSIGRADNVFSYDPHKSEKPINMEAFKGLKWGCDIESYKNFFVLHKRDDDREDPDIKSYTRREDELKIENVVVDEIEYSFYKGKFFCSISRVRNLAEFSRLKEAIITLIGDGGIRMEVNTDDGSAWTCKGKTPSGKEIQIALVSRKKQEDVVLNINYLGIEDEFKSKRPVEEEGRKDQLIREALKIIESHLEINENLTIRSSGDEGSMMQAYRCLKKSSDLEPNNAYLRYATICALRLSAQFASAYKEMTDFSQKNPDFALAKFTLAGWKEEVEGIAPAVFRYPECTPGMTKLPPLYARLVKTCVLLPAREGIYPRAVLFLKDNEAYWTKDMLKDAKVEIAIVHESDNPQLAAIYLRTLLPGKKPDMQECLGVLSLPKADSSIAAWSYLCLQDFVDFVVIDNQKEIILNQRIRLSEGTKKTLSEVKRVLLTIEGRKLSNQEVLQICGKFQNRYSIDDIEQKFFPPK